jgi:hypothetical protein
MVRLAVELIYLEEWKTNWRCGPDGQPMPKVEAPADGSPGQVIVFPIGAFRT